MKFRIAVKHIDLTEEMKEYAKARAEKMERYFDRINSIQVVLNRDGAQYTAEMICTGARGKQLVCTERHKDVFAAMDLVTDKMERQLTKLKEQVRGHHVKGGKRNGRIAERAEETEPPAEDWM